jgi:hypothetical protein
MIHRLVGNPLAQAMAVLTRHNAEASWSAFFHCRWEDVYQAVEILGIGDECLATVRHHHELTTERPWPSELGDGSSIALHDVRRAAASRYAWAIPNDRALDALAALSPIVEIGAGTGYWAALLASRGADVVAYDIDLPGPGNHWHQESYLYFPVQVGGVEMAAKHPDRTLFICWPPYRPAEHMRLVAPDDPFNWEYSEYELDGKTFGQWRRINDEPDVAYEALCFYEQAGGQRVAYIGEGSGGCTGGPSFFARLGAGCPHYDEDDPCTCEPAHWEEIDSVAIPQWEGIHDYLSIYRRK